MDAVLTMPSLSHDSTGQRTPAGGRNGPPAQARLGGIFGAVRSGHEAVLTLRIADANGNPVSPAPAVSADRGRAVATAVRAAQAPGSAAALS